MTSTQNSPLAVPGTVREIRQSFQDFFASKGHDFVRSAPVVPADDPTLMFTNAGMNQFKSIFLGDNSKGLKRVVNSQKCIRVSGKHNDLDEVGRDTYHHTFFEMLGNWSFGDYSKREAITWAWELLTEVWKLDKKRIFVSVFETDDEAYDLWAECTDIDPKRIMRFGAKENFWEMGEVGPCGPCSEIHYDKGPAEDRDELFAHSVKGVNGENDRFIEIWNLVFIQNQRLASGELKPLDQTHVDTGMGLERVCAILQGVHSNYDTDIFKALISKISELSGVEYSDDEAGTSHRVIADHIRTLAFSIADGVMPSNEGRGYVIRRVLRRASRFARGLGQESSFLWKLVATLTDEMGEAFPEIVQRRSFVEEVIRSEEESFIRTLGTGLARFEKMVEETKESGGKVLSGEGVFTLYDTYGFPVDLVRILAEEQNLDVDERGFDKFMAEQKDRARSARKTGVDMGDGEDWVVLDPEQGTDFLGYEAVAAGVKVSRYRLDGKKVDFIARQTPFYAESGGQVGERGILKGNGVELKVLDTVKVNEAWVHRAALLSGEISEENMKGELQAIPNEADRLAVCANHSATHLMHAALRKVLGEHVEQQGSRVSAESLRFDFSHFQALSVEELEKVEEMVNAEIRANLSVNTDLLDLDQAKESGAMALFGEKYEEKVRVVKMGDFSKELCGGLHVKSTGEIGMFRIRSEASTAAGVRRIEAVTAGVALAEARIDTRRLETIRSLVKAKPEKLVTRIEELMAKSRETEKEVEALKAELARGKLKEILSSAQKVGGKSLLVTEVDGGPSALKSLVEELVANLKNGVAVLAASEGESGSIAVVVSKDLLSGLNAGKLVREIAAAADGKGGGRPDRAQAGTRSPEKIPVALELARTILTKSLENLKEGEPA